MNGLGALRSPFDAVAPFAFADMYRVAVTVAEDLYLNVMRFRYELFNIDSVVAKGIGGLALCCLERCGKLAWVVDEPMPLPPPPADAFSMTGKPISRA